MCISTCITSGGTCQFCPIIHLVTMLSAKFLLCKHILFPFVINKYYFETMWMNSLCPRTLHSVVLACIDYPYLDQLLYWWLQSSNFLIPSTFIGWCFLCKNNFSCLVFVHHKYVLRISFLFFCFITRSHHYSFWCSNHYKRGQWEPHQANFGVLLM